MQNTKVTNKDLVNSGSDQSLYIYLVAKRRLTDVRGTLKNFRYGANSVFTELVSNEPKKYTFKDTVVYDSGYGEYGAEASYIDDRSLYYIYFNVEPGFGYYLPENASVKVIRPAGYGSGTEHDPLTYSALYKGDWYDYSPISQKYRTRYSMEATSEMKVYDTNILIKEPKAGGRPAAFVGYDKPTSLPYNMKVLSMQWLGPDQKPMRTYDKFEVGKDYFLDLRIGFEGGEELGHVYPKDSREFKINGKYANSWMDDMDFTDGHIWHVYTSYKLADSSASGTLSGTVKSFNSTTDPVTVQLFKSGSSAAAYNTTVKGNSASYTISGITPGTYTMKVSKKNHVTREYTVTVTTGTKTQNAEIRLLGDVNGDGRVNAMDYTRLLKHVNETQPLTDAYALKCSDVNRDKRVNAMDYTRLLKHVNETQPLW